MAKTLVAMYSHDEIQDSPGFLQPSGWISIAFEEMLPFVDEMPGEDLFQLMEMQANGQNVHVLILSDYSRESRSGFRNAIDKAVEVVEAESEEDYNTFENEKQIILWTLNNMAKVIDESGVLDYERPS